jgi:hypothetical protein
LDNRNSTGAATRQTVSSFGIGRVRLGWLLNCRTRRQKPRSHIAKRDKCLFKF